MTQETEARSTRKERIVQLSGTRRPGFDDDIPTTMGSDDPGHMSDTSPRSPCLIALSGPRLGKTFPVDKDSLIIGRAPDCDIVLLEPSVSARHAELCITDTGVVVVDLASRNGTYVNGERVETWKLHDGDRIQVGGQTLFRYALQDEIERGFFEHQYHSATRDQLTGLFARRYLFEMLSREMAFAHRYQRVLSLVMVDVDHFKRINDEHGHPAGDYLLRQLANVMLGSVRTDDVVGRYGGEEFCVLLRETPHEYAFALAERLRMRVASTSFAWLGQAVPLTVSLGVATGPSGAILDAEHLLATADRLLYEAKRAGRNRVHGFGASSERSPA